MTIAVDGNEANIANRVGIGRYASNVLDGLHKINESKKNPVKFRIYLKNKPLSHLPPESSNWRYHVLYPPILWSQLALPMRLLHERNKTDLLYSTSHYSPKFSVIPSIISIMDLSYIHYPHMFKVSDYYKLKYWTALSAKKASKIITISRFTRSEIIKYYSVNPDKIIVVYPGVNHDKYKPNNKSNKKGFFLYVGTLQPRKNITGLIEAFSRLKNRDNLSLMIVGQKGWLYQGIFDEVKKKGLESKIKFCDYVTENELISYYQDAACLVLPSFYEGFGIPVIEAMACGCPVIASNISSLPEISGDAAQLVDPYSIDSIKGGIEKVLTDNNYRNMMIERGLERAKYFNWLKCARQTYDVLKSA